MYNIIKPIIFMGIGVRMQKLFNMAHIYNVFY